MRASLDQLGADWLAEEVNEWTDHIDRIEPSEYNEAHRILPEGTTRAPGPISFDLNPFMREILDACSPWSGVREVNLLKGVQISYSTILDSILLYCIGYLKSVPCMYISADKELAKGRIENYIIPMLNASGMSDLIQSNDMGNQRKTGKTAGQLQWVGPGFLIPTGAINAAKMRMWSVQYLLKDEIDAWPDLVGRDGDPDSLTDARADTFGETKKIFRGSTPLIAGLSKITRQYERGDQRKYNVPCKGCGKLQPLRWEIVDKETGVKSGVTYDLTDEGTLVPGSVRYVCPYCGHAHTEYDKRWMFDPANGAKWVPTAKPIYPGIRSYHLPALYSPAGFKSWEDCVVNYLDAFDGKTGKVRNIEKCQVFYNNILAKAFEVRGSRVKFEQVSLHRRSYNMGEIPNEYADAYSGGPIIFLTCQVDVHKSNLAVAVLGWTVGMRCYVIRYDRFEDEDCTQPTSPVWERLRKLVMETRWTADDGREYNLLMTAIDAGYNNDLVVTFCQEFETGVIPILGRDRPSKNQRITEFAPWKTRAGTTGYRITVDHYKDRMAAVLRRGWTEGQGEQEHYHFNAPINISDDQLKELTREVRKKKTDPNGRSTYVWSRPGGAEQELWDLLGYGYALVEIIAYEICVQHYELETVDWRQFWQFAAENYLPETAASAIVEDN